jgi:stalled ribosome rescue protein Dom34
MTMFHAVVWLDHQQAQILQFDADHVQASKIKAHTHHTRQHGSQVRSEHEFFAELCGALAGIKEVLITGSHQAQADFQRYVNKHRPLVAPQIVGYETVDHMSENQLIAMARKYFLKFDRMSGTPTPT